MPLAVIGIACLFPGARSVRDYWANIKLKVDAITDVPDTHWRRSDYFAADPQVPDMTYAQRGAFIDPIAFDPLDYGISPNNIEATDTTQLLAMVLAREALSDAGYAATPESEEGRPFDRDRASVILGVTGALPLVIPLGARLGHPIWRRALSESGVDADTAEQVVQRIAEGYVPWQENSFPGLLGNVAAGRIANRFDLGGMNCVVDAACASSLSALHMAAMELESGRTDMVLTGGLDTFNDIFMYMCFSKTPALSPSGRSRPFSHDGDGTALGEGLGILALRRLADAERDGDRIHAVVRGIGAASDGRGSAIYAPQVEGQIKAVRAAYAQAEVSPDTIELLEAHGTGTRVGDATELDGITQVFESSDRSRPWCALGSVKSMIGHTKAAAGVAGVIKAILALEHKVLPPTLHVEQPLEKLAGGGSPVYINTEPRPWVKSKHHPRRAGVSAFGFGGSNFHCVLEEHAADKHDADWTSHVALLPLQADSRAELEAELASLDTEQSWGAVLALGVSLRKRFVPGHGQRLCLILERGRSDLARLKARAADVLSRGLDDRPWQLPDGAFFGAGPNPGRLAMLFPGQGAQYPGMLRDLSCLFPEMLDALALGDEICAGGESPLSGVIYPPPRFADAERKSDAQRLTDTRLAQPAIGVLSLGALRTLRRFALHPDAVAGHSFGELTALYAAGRLNESELVELAALRGRLMAELGTGEGAMASASQTPAELDALIARERLDVVIANYNAPNQTVLSGSVRDIERALAALRDAGIDSRRLPVSAAFHSPMVAPAHTPFANALQAYPLPAAECPVYANATAAPYPQEPAAARELLAEQLVRPVKFAALIENLYTDGVRTFLEVGPGRSLSGLVGATLGEREHRVFALDASRGRADGSYDLASALAGLAAAGHDVDLAQWDPDSAPAVAEEGGLRIGLGGANYVRERERTPPHVPSVERSSGVGEIEDPPASERQPKTDQPVGAGERPGDVAQALELTQQQLAALQQMQEQTARLHRQYLENQEGAQRTLERLVDQQQRLLAGDLGLATQGVLRAAVPAPPGPPPVEPPKLEPQLHAGIDAPPCLLDTVLDVVSEKTGYPVDMLSPQMSLDADLGIDSIKRVEIMAALRDRVPEAPEVAPQELGGLETLADVAALLETATTTPTGPVVADSRMNHLQLVLDTVADKTGYPVEMLEPDLSLDADLGIDSIKRVEIMAALRDRVPQAPEANAEELAALLTLRDVGEFLAAARAPAQARAPEPQAPCAAHDVELERQVLCVSPLSRETTRNRLELTQSGCVWISDDGSSLAPALCETLQGDGMRARVVDLGGEPNAEAISGLILLAPQRHDPGFVHTAFRLMRGVGGQLRLSGRGGGARLLGVSRLDGAFGLNGRAPRDPASAALAGLVKTAAHEWPEVACKALDLADDFHDASEPARDIADEFFCHGPVEVGISRHGRCALGLSTLPLNGAPGRLPLEAGDLVVITGGARGITAHVAAALARACRPSLLLLGRTEIGEAEPEWLTGLCEPTDIKHAIAARRSGTDPLTPQELERRARTLLAAREVRANIERIRHFGGEVLYHSVDIRDAAKVADVVEVARARFGQVRGLIHAAGVLADRLIEDKTDAQFTDVFSTKVDGLNSLLGAIDGDEVRVMSLFSSSTGRFGRKGQIDYAAANEVLNKVAHQQARARPQCRVLSLNWGPWDGGMVTPRIRRVFEDEGIGLIPVEAGARHLVRELATPIDGPVEVVITARAPASARLDAGNVTRDA